MNLTQILNSKRQKNLLASCIQNKIYGVTWGQASSPVMTRTDSSIGLVAAAGVGATPVTNTFDTAQIFKDITEVTDALGNVFVRIPKFYIFKSEVAGLTTTKISKKQYAGFYLPYCFWDFTNSRELAYVDVGKYAANLSGANKLESKSGYYPLVIKNIVDFRGYAQANGAGYQQMDLHVYDMLSCLFYIEFANLNAQSIMNGWVSGRYAATHLATVAETAVNRIIVANAFAALYAVGQPISIGSTQGDNQIFYGRNITSIDVYDASNKAISFDGAAVNIAIGNYLYHVGWKSGACATVAAKSGSFSSNSNGLSPFIYRGIENLWGNVYQFVDGVNITDRQAWVCLNPASYASNVFASPYVQLAYANGAVDGYLIAKGFDATYPFARFPITVGGASNTYYADYYYSSTGQRIALVGGSWSSGTYDGPFDWSLVFSSSSTYFNIGGRLVKKAL